MRKWFLLSTQVNYNANFRVSLEDLAASKSDVLILNRCLQDDQIYTRCDGKAVYKYPHVHQVQSRCISIFHICWGITSDLLGGCRDSDMYKPCTNIGMLLYLVLKKRQLG